MYLTINNKDIWPYEWIMKSDGSTQWDILPIIYDNAKIELYKNENNRYTLWYKVSKNLIWQEIKYADIVNEITGETFSFQVKNIFFAQMIHNDLKVLALVWDEIKLYENFWKSQKLIETDGDKKETTPFGYYNMFLSYDDNYYYPLILNEKINQNVEIKRFYDYYGYRAYEDSLGNEHVFILIEHEKSSESNPLWYYTDNFNIISEKLDFNGDNSEYVEEWGINQDWNIYMTTTSGKKWYLDKASKKIIEWSIPQSINQNFTFTRFFEDTDGEYIVAKNEKWYFLINRTKTKISDTDKEKIVYYNWFLWHKRNSEYSFFLMKNSLWEIVLVNENSVELLTTDLDDNDIIGNIVFLDENLIEIEVNKEKRQYII